jgi:polysaccharide deacetylase 2 family uncharacterized protein YibQ
LNANNKKKKFPLLFLILLGCLTTLGLFLYFSNSVSKSSSPVYEDIYAVSSDLNEKISQIDHTIYDSLFERGIEEKDVSFSMVIPRHEKDYDWDFTELLIKLPNSDYAISLEDIIYDRLSRLKPSVKVDKEKISDSEIVCNVYALGLYTHRIKLIYKEQEKIIHEGLPRIAIVIDDIGYDRDLAIAFMDLDLPLSLSILPSAPHTVDIVNEANRRGTELLLHLPMEPKDYPNLNPGQGALLTNMDEERIKKIFSDDIAQVPGLRGVNHHMGSYFTERYDKMKIVLSEVKKRNLFYLDSRTTNRTVAFDLAKDMGVPAAKKSLFLDNDLSSKAIKLQMERLFGIARYSGIAVGIGHPHKETLQVLQEYINQLKTDFKVVPVSELAD